MHFQNELADLDRTLAMPDMESLRGGQSHLAMGGFAGGRLLYKIMHVYSCIAVFNYDLEESIF